MAKQRITEDFVKHHKLLTDRTGNSPHNVFRALDRDPQLAVSIEELDHIWRQVERHRRFSKRRFIIQAHPAFAAAKKDYQERWIGAWFDLIDWKDRKAGRKTLTEMIDEDIADMPLKSSAEDLPNIDDEDWEFDPDNHSAALLVENAVDYIDMRNDDEAWFSRSSGAFQWFGKTVGLDFAAIEERFKEFPVIVVPEQVSNKHGIEDPRSLYAYLNDIRSAYVIGADLAAVAMCRACTEILMCTNYNRDNDANLTDLIKKTQAKREFAHLRVHNLVAKVREANNLLHFNRPDIGIENRSRPLIRDWVAALQDIIARAPTH